MFQFREHAGLSALLYLLWCDVWRSIVHSACNGFSVMWYVFWYWPAKKCIHRCTCWDKFWLVTFQCKCAICEKKCNLRQPSRHSQLWKVGFYSVEIVLLNYQFVSLSPCLIVESLSNRREKLSTLAKIFCDVMFEEQTSIYYKYGKTNLISWLHLFQMIA